MGNNNHQLEIRTVSQLKGHFRIPSYQRGYRWERRQVEQLLNDIVKSPDDSPYYLQPIVVAPALKAVKESAGDKSYDYDIIDGQQRLTTIYIILKALEDAKAEQCSEASILLRKTAIEIGYSLSYETRSSSRTFLKNISKLNVTKDKDLILNNPDHLYMWHAYGIVKKWIADLEEPTALTKLAKALSSRDDSHKNAVKIIWYELPESILDWKKFTELNIGKIQLTNSELVKALLMRTENNDISDEQKSTIIQQWDIIEKELSNPDFWGFLTSRDMKNYDTKIDLLFDILARKSQNSKDDYFTFSHFEEKFADNNRLKGKKKWDYIYLQYQQLRDWYLDRELFHKIGYLSTVDRDEKLYHQLITFITSENESEDVRPTNSQFREYLETKIVESIKLPENVSRIEELCYRTNDGSNKHQPCIHQLLTLYNVLYTQEHTKDRYDFHAHKSSAWTLEHIHAQNSANLSTVEQQREWIVSHLDSLRRYLDLPEIDKESLPELISLAGLMERYTERDSALTGKIFSDIAILYSELIVSANDENATRGEYEHQFDNMALLSHDENAAFNNSTFDVKRHKMLKDISQKHIPVCTQRVFLKSIPNADDNRPYFWGSKDRDAYIDDIRTVLGKYLSKIEIKSVEPDVISTYPTK